MKCKICGVGEAVKKFNNHPMIMSDEIFPCDDCSEKHFSTSQQRKWYEKQATSLWKTPTGEEVAVDQRGNITDNPYKNRNYDNHGWMQTSKNKYKKYLESTGKL